MARILIGTANLWFGPRLHKKLTASGHCVERYSHLANLATLVELEAPQLVVLDLRDQPRQAWEIFTRLSADRPELPILLLSSTDPEAVELALRLVSETFTPAGPPSRFPAQPETGTEPRLSAAG